MIDLMAVSASRSLLDRLPERPSPGMVHSAFPRAVNLRWSRDGWCSLLEGSLPLLPDSILVHDLPASEGGEGVCVSRAEIAFRDRPLRIRLEAATSADLRVRIGGPIEPRAVKERTSALRRSLSYGKTDSSLLPFVLGLEPGAGTDAGVRSGSCPDGLPPVLPCGPRGRESLRATLCERSVGRRQLSGFHLDLFFERSAEAIERAREARDGEEKVEALLSLIGLGQGLTPSGDDFLVGYLAASEAFDRSGKRGRLLASAIQGRARGRTTEVGYRMLLAACRGEFPMPIVRLVESLAWGESDPYGPAADTLAVGSSSGADMLAGIFFGIEESLRE